MAARGGPAELGLEAGDSHVSPHALADDLALRVNDVPGRLDELDREKQIIVFCHHGVRSYSVASFLKQQGFPNVLSMAGGIEAWSLEVDPAVPRY
ncbi:MAG: sulfurtransferase [Planctomycetes bacterium]|nr:sulfurtransferase [Planctomycetota bacterium]